MHPYVTSPSLSVAPHPVAENCAVMFTVTMLAIAGLSTCPSAAGRGVPAGTVTKSMSVAEAAEAHANNNTPRIDTCIKGVIYRKEMKK